MTDEQAPEPRDKTSENDKAADEDAFPKRRRSQNRKKIQNQDVDPSESERDEEVGEDRLDLTEAGELPTGEKNRPEPTTSRRMGRNRRNVRETEDSPQDILAEEESRSPTTSARQKFFRRIRTFFPSLVAAGLVLAAAFVIVEARFLPLPRKNYVLTPAAVPARNTVKVCPAPPRLLEMATGIDPKFSPLPREAQAQVKAFALEDSPNLSLKDLSGKNLAAADTYTSGKRPVMNSGRQLAATSKVEAQSSGDKYAEVASAFHYVSAAGDIQGLSVANCQTPKNELWISGIATSLGYTSILSVTNPGLGSATVNITLYDEQGVINSAASSQLVVEAQSERSVMLAALGRSKDRLTVKVSSNAGAIAATVAQNKMRGLSPGGVEILTPGEEPAARQVIPAYRQENPKDIRELSSQFGYQDATPSLQVTAPYEDARVHLRIYGPDGEEKSGEREFDLRAHTVRDISLEELPEGTYTLEVSSNSGDIVAAAKMISGKRGQNMDFAWAHGTKAVAPQHIFALADLQNTTVSLFAANGRGKIQFKPVTADGSVKEQRDFNLQEGKVVSFRPEDYGSDIVGFMVGDVEGSVFAAQTVSITSNHQVSWMEIPRPTQEQSGIPVILQY